MFEADDFRDDPYGWITNQCGHLCIGAALFVVLSIIGLSPFFALLWSAILYLIVGEVALQSGNMLLDAAVDLAFVTAGAFVLCAVDIGDMILAGIIIAGAAIALLIGYLKRRT